ncbi:MAG: sarcosine oxidase subunit gamma [Hyphomicrobiaceae bacterium]|nr:MAG: sarcosine oxidase subunit gamma [Hyphomicrobiaceae bacterium]
MRETLGVAWRDLVLPAKVPDLEVPTSIAAMGACARFSLRLPSAQARAVDQAGGFALSGGVNSAITSGGSISARLGPDEWLLIGPEEQGDALSQAIEVDLDGRFFSLVDVSHRNAAIAVAGREARAVLNAGIALDLDDAAFPPGSATRTLLGKAEIVLIRPGAECVYWVECWRSFAAYVHGFLMEAAREFGPHR